jgi:predicted small lipoprotein YifL
MIPKPRTSLAVAAALVVGLALTGCGKKGALDAPSAAVGSASSQTAQADSGQGKPAGATPKPHQGFILDGLLR